MEGIVISYLDILRKGETGLLWIGTASSLEDANSQIRARANDAGEFVIFNSRTGDRISVWPGLPEGGSSRLTMLPVRL
jgi:hypothetical protein